MPDIQLPDIQLLIARANLTSRQIDRATDADYARLDRRFARQITELMRLGLTSDDICALIVCPHA